MIPAIANFVSAAQVASAVEQAGLPPAQVTAITGSYAAAQIAALRTALAGIAIFALIALWYVRNLPTRASDQPSSGQSREEPLSSTPDA